MKLWSTGLQWQTLNDEFLLYHKSPGNIAAHQITVFAGFCAFWALVYAMSTPASLILALVYPAVLSRFLPHRLWLSTVLVLLAQWGLVLMLSINWEWALSLVILSSALQELAHVIFREKTYQSTYIREPGWIRKSILHTLLLLPLMVDLSRQQFPLGFLLARRRILDCHLGAEFDTDMQALRQWILDQQPPNDKTSHWWRADLSTNAHGCFDAIGDADVIHNGFRDLFSVDAFVERIPAMDEVYVAGPDRNLSSDKVFPMPHTDGPYAVYPGASVYRCLVAVGPNQQVTTHFPMSHADFDAADDAYCLQTGDVLGFDYHRELHFIRTNTEADDCGPRMVMKLHYLVGTSGLKGYSQVLARLSARYNQTARELFLATIKPTSIISRILALWILLSTKVFQYVQRYCGAANLAWVGVCAGATAISGNPVWMLAGTSYVHYLIYIRTFSTRERLSFNTFRRDATFFKTVSMLQLFMWAGIYFQPSLIALLLVIVGYSISALAAMRLGPVRTFFGAEQGEVPYEKVAGFPYGWIPHPMIVGALTGLIGLSMFTGLTERFGWLIPLHIGFYLVHLAQEIWVGHRGSAPADEGRADAL
ncbi:Uncharacterised protein [BD1-7 clade bacterium]|uniref:phosphatidyl-N-methylethanolamine N-methyltransferase n=1 Tax=BD1-7 clade bacterium TaxID=2029982 RepID=A0A5S9QHL5_9GAMM|nr:Uncharacterised protein [BD1-7 clade bacterium]